MEFYIWNEGGTADEVLEAVIRAAERGVSCRLLIDALGARPWWKGKQPQRLREAGVDVRPALPVGLFRTLVGRTDLRLHRKIVVIDGAGRLDRQHEPGRSALLQAGGRASASGSMPWSVSRARSWRRWPRR